MKSADAIVESLLNEKRPPQLMGVIPTDLSSAAEGAKRLSVMLQKAAKTAAKKRQTGVYTRNEEQIAKAINVATKATWRALETAEKALKVI